MHNYTALGFKCGLEIHQQLSTKKLFCDCPSLVNDPASPDVFFSRKLRAVAGESGKVDQAAAYEMQKNRVFQYEGCSSSSCLVELDEEPPHAMNEEAVKTALQVALLLKCQLVDHVQIMRKTVVDGSNVSGFQRTALIGFNGIIDSSKGKVKIETVCLEEESAKKVETKENVVVYRLDRLGVPLIEIATDASIKDPEHCAEVAGLIGMVLRSTGKVRRGIGSIRQDVNVSIKGSARVELKGFQEIRSMAKVIDTEITRLQSVKDHKSEVRKVNPDNSSSFLRPMPGAARMYPETDVPTFALSKKLLEQIELPELITEKAIRLEKQYGISSELARELVEDEETFASLVKKFKNVSPALLGKVLVEMPKEIKARFNVQPSMVHIEETLGALNENKISKDAVFEVLCQKAQGKTVDVSRFTQVSDEELKSFIKVLKKTQPDAKPNVLMGEVMKVYRGRIDGKKAMEIIQSL